MKSEHAAFSVWAKAGYLKNTSGTPPGSFFCGEPRVDRPFLRGSGSAAQESQSHMEPSSCGCSLNFFDSFGKFIPGGGGKEGSCLRRC